MSTMFIGIVGGTGSGKAVLTRHPKELFGDSVTVIGHDSYDERQKGKTYGERGRTLHSVAAQYLHARAVCGTLRK